MLMETEVSGYDTFNLGRGIEYSVREVVEAFSRQVGEPIAIEQDPKRTRKTDRMHLLADIGKLKAATGWAPQISLDEGIATLVGTEAYRVG
jgi:UDP-glucose 4-epimerase